MSEEKSSGGSVGGSRFLYESFGATSARIEANERVAKLQFDALSDRLERIEAMIERQEKRLWLAVYGVAAVVLVQGVTTLLDVAPR